MSDSHLSLADLAAAGGFAPDDPRRRHLERCVRCRMLHRRYEGFMSGPGTLPAEARRDAEDHLARFLEREITGADAAQAAGKAPAGPRRNVRGARAWSKLQPALAWAAVVLAVAAAVFVFQQRPFGTRVSGVLRGDTTPDAGAALMLRPPASGADGAITLGWRAAPGAERYQVRVYAGDLRVLALLDAAGETTLTVPRGAIAGAAAGDTVIWRVFALRDGAPLARSEPATLRVP